MPVLPYHQLQASAHAVHKAALMIMPGKNNVEIVQNRDSCRDNPTFQSITKSEVDNKCDKNENGEEPNDIRIMNHQVRIRFENHTSRKRREKREKRRMILLSEARQRI